MIPSSMTPFLGFEFDLAPLRLYFGRTNSKFFSFFFNLIKRVERTERKRFPGTMFPAVEKPFKMFNDNQDITVRLDEQALNKKGWELDETPASQVTELIIYVPRFTLQKGSR